MGAVSRCARFDVLNQLIGANKYAKFLTTSVEGLVQERILSKATAERKGTLIKIPGASLSVRQFLVWRFTVRGFVADTSYKFLSVPGLGQTVSCYSWAAEAGASAWVIARIPF